VMDQEDQTPEKSAPLDMADTPAAELAEHTTILVVDDSRFDRRYIRQLIDKSGVDCKLFEADDLISLTHLLGLRRYSLILIDYALADGTGFDALHRCKASELNRDSLFVMVTGNDTSDLAVSAIKNGFDDYLNKDNLNYGSIFDLLEEALKKRQSAFEALA